MLTELPVPKGLTGSSGNSKTSTTIKGNCWEEWSRRRRHQELQDSEEEGRHTRKSRTFGRHWWGAGRNLISGKKQTARKGQECYVILRNYGTLGEKWGNIKKSRLALKVFISYKGNKIYKEGIALHHSKEKSKT